MQVVLDHLIVQRMEHTDAEAPDELESILKYGARALFEGTEGEADSDIVYTAHDIEKLLDCSEADEGASAKTGGDRSSKAFSYARIVSVVILRG
jgi:chromodomain-helicase-DNA-binding protein 4